MIRGSTVQLIGVLEVILSDNPLQSLTPVVWVFCHDEPRLSLSFDPNFIIRHYLREIRFNALELVDMNYYKRPRGHSGKFSVLQAIPKFYQDEKNPQKFNTL